MLCPNHPNGCNLHHSPFILHWIDQDLLGCFMLNIIDFFWLVRTEAAAAAAATRAEAATRGEAARATALQTGSTDTNVEVGDQDSFGEGPWRSSRTRHNLCHMHLEQACGLAGKTVSTSAAV